MNKQTKLFPTYTRPKTAYKKLDTAWKNRQNIYIHAILGFGKTTLVRYYFRNEPYLYYSAKSGSLKAEETNDCLTEYQILIFDDLSFLTNEEDKAFIREQLAQKKCLIIMIGRTPIPKWLKLSFYEDPFILIDEKDLSLEHSERILFFNKHGIVPSPELISQLHRRLFSNPLFAGMIATHLKNGIPYTDLLLQSVIEDAYIHLENQLFQKWGDSLYDFMMQLSIVDSFTYRLAEMITERDDTESALNQLMEIGSFLILQDGQFFMHPFLLPCLRQRISTEFTKEKLKDLYHKAARYYEMENQLPEAIKMYEACGDQNCILNILIMNVSNPLNMDALFELRRYYLALSEETISQSIPLMTGICMLYSLLMMPEESEYWYRALKHLEKKEAEIPLCYLDVALPHRGSHKAKENLASFSGILLKHPIDVPEFSVTSNLPSVMNGGKDFCDWSLNDQTLEAFIDKPIAYALGKYAKGFAEIALGESLYEKGGDSYEIITLLNKGRCFAENGGKIEMCFVAVGLLARMEMCNGQLKNAQKLLDTFRRKVYLNDALQLLPNLDALDCRLALRRGDEINIAKWMDIAPSHEDVEFYIRYRYIYLTKIRVYLLEKNWEPALSLIQRMLYYAEKYDRIYIQMEASLLLAVYQYRTQNPQWQTTFRKLLTKAEYYGFISLIAEEGCAVLPLLQQCDCQDISATYYERLLEASVRMAKQYPAYLAADSLERIELSSQALNILRMQDDGLTAKEIADKLHISEATVRYHNKNIYSKLGASGKLEALRIAKEMHLI